MPILTGFGPHPRGPKSGQGKLADLDALRQNLQNQVGIYEAANDTAKSIKAILYFTENDLERVLAVLKDLGLSERRDVVLIDACRDNKPSASNA